MFDLISDRNLLRYVFILCRRRCLKRRRTRNRRRIFRSYRYPARGFHHWTRSFICSFLTISWKQDRRNERRRDERRENDEKWTVTRISFNRPDTYTSARVKASTKIVVSFHFFPPSSCRSSFLRSTISFVTSSGYTVKTFTVAADPSDEHRTSNNSIIDRHIQPTTRVIAPFDELRTIVNRNTH